MPRPRQKLVGKQIGYWTIMEEGADVYASNGCVKRVLVAKCRCGTVRSVLEQNVISKRSLSCGCLKRELAQKHQEEFWRRKIGVRKNG